jgi:hypothetical protein
MLHILLRLVPTVILYSEAIIYDFKQTINDAISQAFNTAIIHVKL